MPVCKICSKPGPTANFRRSPKGGYLCLDKAGCKHDAKIRKAGGEPGPRSLQSLLRF
jgi:hypothetical protein